jgi:hypothetical protein
MGGRVWCYRLISRDVLGGGGLPRERESPRRPLQPSAARHTRGQTTLVSHGRDARPFDNVTVPSRPRQHGETLHD